MTLQCAPVDADAGVVLRFAANAECAAQSIGADGFQAMIGGPLAAGLLSALVTIFVAIIGYRLVLGNAPRFDEGIGRVLRLGIVLALVTGWPAFQTLVYDTATRGPEEVASTILPAVGLSPADLPTRVQTVYDAMRLGAAGDPRTGDAQQAGATASASTPQNGATGTLAQQGAMTQPGLGALPQTASVFAVVTVGTLASLHLAVGILLALAPLAILALLFDGTLGLFNGWLRAVAGTVLAGLAATIVVVVTLIPIEQEALRLQGWRGGGVFAAVDAQALPTLVLASAVAMLVAVLAAMRMGSALRYAPGAAVHFDTATRHSSRSESSVTSGMRAPAAPIMTTGLPGRDRATGVAEALSATVRREERLGSSAAAGARAAAPTTSIRREDALLPTAVGAGLAARRTTLRRSRAARSRDRVGK